MSVKLEQLTGTIDGVNTQFTVSSDYVAGSVVVFLNGQAIVGHVTEQPPRTLEFPADCIPKAGDHLYAYYRSL